MRPHLRQAAALLAVLCGPCAAAPGAVKLDNYTFDKVLSIPEYSVLVKFDKTYAYGEKEDEFKLLCKTAYTVPKFLIAEVGVQEWGDKENDDLRERFNIAKEDFPVYYFFKSGDKAGAKYSGEVKSDLLSQWLRTDFGVKVPRFGTIAEMDELVKKFFEDGMSADQIEEAKKLADGAYKQDKKASMYVKILEKVKEKGEEYVTTETTRVSKLMDGKLTPEKKTELSDKLKILGVFSRRDEL
mmetsp:Transcript_51639/g.122904  ORF Transcript_51639/g.122904 Transcript_51639/m.122904 type:complete len:241 (-) Transcript_51639:64-786(-)